MMCSRCEFKNHKPGLWFEHVWFLYRLQAGGYPFEANDLTIEDWIDLGLLREELEALKRKS